MASSKKVYSIKNWNLLFAVRDNNYKRVKQLLIDGADPNFTPDDTVDGGRGPLHSAVRLRLTDMVRILLNYNADPNLEDEEGDTPLFSALFSYTPLAIRQLLIRSGADRNHKNKRGTIPLMKMIENYMYWDYEFDKHVLLELLFSCNNLYQKTTNGMSLVHLLLVIHSSERSVVSTPNHVCIVYLHFLIKKGIPMDTLDPLGRTAIHYAASAGCFQSIALLIENGVNANIKDIKGQTPFHHLRFHLNKRMNACKLELPKLIDVLIKHGCDINERDFFGRTIVHYTANTDSTTKLSSLKLLHNKGAILTIKDKANMTALHLAVLPILGASEVEDECDNLSKLGAVDAIKFLVENGISVNETDSSRLTALHLAVREQSTDVIQALIQLGADVNITTKTGESAFHRATIYIKNLECVIQYCNLGKIDTLKQDNFGSIPLDWASSNHNEKLAPKLNFTQFPKLYPELNCAEYSETFEYDKQYKFQYRKNPVYSSFNLKFRKINITKPTFVEKHTNELENVPTKATQTIPVDTMHTKAPDNATNITEQDATIESSLGLPDFEKINGKTYTTKDKETKLVCYQKTKASDTKAIEMTDYFIRDTDNEHELEVDAGMSVNPKMLDQFYYLNLREKNKEDSWKFVKNVFANPPLNMALVDNIAENECVAAAVHALLLYISEKINSDFPLFANSISLTGSWNEGTKTIYPNEFDYNWHLSNFNEAFTINKNTTLCGGYVRLHLKESMKASDFASYVNEEGDLDGRKVICDFYQIINNILLLADIACPGSIYVKKYLSIDKGSIDKLVLEWVGPVYKCMLVNIDIVPSIEAKHLSSNNIRLDRNIMERIRRDEPLEIVMKTQNERVVRDANFYFRISVAKQESLIIKSLPTPVKKGFSLLKVLREFVYPHSLTHKRDFEIMLTTYKLKTCFLHVLEEAAKNSEDIACEYVPQEFCIEKEKTTDIDEKEEQEKIAKKKLLEFKASKRITIDWAYRIVDFLSRSIEDAFLPSFFLPSVNLLVNESHSICNDIHICMKECERLNELLAEEMKKI